VDDRELLHTAENGAVDEIFNCPSSIIDRHAVKVDPCRGRGL
jgi:hypothetical protein